MNKITITAALTAVLFVTFGPPSNAEGEKSLAEGSFFNGVDLTGWSGNQGFIVVALVLGVAAIAISNYVLEKHDVGDETPSMLSRWAGIIATLDISAVIAMTLIRITKTAGHPEAIAKTSDKLSGVSYTIIGVVVLVVVGGLGWCFYRAIAAASKDQKQEPVEVTQID